MPRSTLLRVLTLVLWLVGSVTSLRAQTILDQINSAANLGLSFESWNLPLGQSFTPVVSGLLDSIGLRTNGSLSAGTALLTLEVRSGDGLGGTFLGGVTTQDIAGRFTPNTHDFSVDLRQANIQLEAGSRYTFVISSVGGTSDFALRGSVGSDNNLYTGGQLYAAGYTNTGGWDLTFSTNVTPVPEPSTLVLLAVGLGLVPLALRRRRVCARTGAGEGR